MLLYIEVAISQLPCADPEGEGTRGPDPLKNHENIGFLSNAGPDPLKNQAIVSPPAKRHLTGVSLAGR